MMIAGTPFDMADIEDVWPRIAERARRTRSDAKELQAICDRCHPGGDAACLQGPDGVVVMSARGLPGGGIVAMVLLAVSYARPGAFKRQEAAMVAIAKDLHAKAISFKTDRRGWGRMLGPAWHLDGDTFTRSTV